MTTTREVRDAHDERVRCRRRWTCAKCRAEGLAANVVIALAELMLHDATAHTPPPLGVIEGVP